MLFSSLTFLFVFLPLVFAVYFLTPEKYKNLILLISSWIFYAWGGVSYSIILIASILANFFFAKGISVGKNKRRILQLAITFNVLLIVCFKYLDFFIRNLNLLVDVFGVQKDIKELGIILPLGISFFTFQQMSMLWDVYRSENNFKIRFVETALYISLFPQLIAGPIVRYHDIIEQLKKRVHSFEKIEYGIKRFILGLFKKVVFANTCAIIADQIFVLDISQLDTAAAWLGILAYSLQIYFDFSGYSDMAIGLGSIFGFKILENFNFPYISKSIQEFWRRWHISLSSWFRDYVYFPLGGNRKGVNRTYMNLLIVFLLTGFWHGATWSFIFWGVFHGFFLILERLGLKKILEKYSLLGHLYTLLAVMIAWVFFKVESFQEALNYVTQMFSFQSDLAYSAYSFLDLEKLVILSLAILSCTRLFQILKDYFAELIPKSNFTLNQIKSCSYLILFLIAVVQLNSGSYNPFIYFRF